MMTVFFIAAAFFGVVFILYFDELFSECTAAGGYAASEWFGAMVAYGTLPSKCFFQNTEKAYEASVR
jgi:hypothetical protein